MLESTSRAISHTDFLTKATVAHTNNYTDVTLW
jgi:hypothetical protein